MRADEHPLYDAWSQMRQRCLHPEHPYYKYYGGRGIYVCRRWRDFWKFVSDMGPRPSPLYTLDRYPDNDGPYAPWNCRWATSRQQARNTRVVRLITYQGATKSVSSWARKLGVTSSAVFHRIRKHGEREAIQLGGRLK